MKQHGTSSKTGLDEMSVFTKEKWLVDVVATHPNSPSVLQRALKDWKWCRLAQADLPGHLKTFNMLAAESRSSLVAALSLFSLTWHGSHPAKCEGGDHKGQWIYDFLLDATSCYHQIAPLSGSPVTPLAVSHARPSFQQGNFHRTSFAAVEWKIAASGRRVCYLRSYP